MACEALAAGWPMPAYSAAAAALLLLQVDRATYKARHFDDWKDGHPKGAGVTKRV